MTSKNKKGFKPSEIVLSKRSRDAQFRQKLKLVLLVIVFLLPLLVVDFIMIIDVVNAALGFAEDDWTGMATAFLLIVAITISPTFLINSFLMGRYNEKRLAHFIGSEPEHDKFRDLMIGFGFIAFLVASVAFLLMSIRSAERVIESSAGNELASTTAWFENLTSSLGIDPFWASVITGLIPFFTTFVSFTAGALLGRKSKFFLLDEAIRDKEIDIRGDNEKIEEEKQKFKYQNEELILKETSLKNVYQNINEIQWYITEYAEKCSEFVNDSTSEQESIKSPCTETINQVCWEQFNAFREQVEKAFRELRSDASDDSTTDLIQLRYRKWSNFNKEEEARLECVIGYDTAKVMEEAKSQADT